MERIDNYAVANGYNFFCEYIGDIFGGYYKITDLSNLKYYPRSQFICNRELHHKTVEDAIRHLGSSRKVCVLPDGRQVIPDEFNYPGLSAQNIFQPWHPGVVELWPGEPGWGE